MFRAAVSTISLMRSGSPVCDLDISEEDSGRGVGRTESILWPFSHCVLASGSTWLLCLSTHFPSLASPLQRPWLASMGDAAQDGQEHSDVRLIIVTRWGWQQVDSSLLGVFPLPRDPWVWENVRIRLVSRSQSHTAVEWGQGWSGSEGASRHASIAQRRV